MNKAQKLLEAHLQFELDRWTDENCGEDLDVLLDALWDWAGDTSVEQMLSAETAVDAVLRWVDDWYLPDTLTVLLGSLAKRLIHLPINQETRLEDVIDDQLIEAGVDLLVDLERLREALITQATQSPLYAMLISNVLYSGIRDYLSGESGVAQKVPGMSSLLSKGASALNKRMPGLEAAIEDRLRKYIASNAQKSIRGSRKFLLEALNAEQLRKLAEQIWDNSRQTQLTVAELLEDDEIDRLVSFGLAIWQDLRQTEYIQELIREAVYGFYDGYGNEDLRVLLQHLGLNRDGLLAEARRLIPSLLRNAHDSGLLQSWLELRLRPFYASAACAKLLA